MFRSLLKTRSNYLLNLCFFWSQIDHPAVRPALIRMLGSWQWVYKMVVANGPKTIIREHNRAVLVHVAAIAAVLLHLIVREAVLMVLRLRRQQMVMDLHQTWAPCHPRPAVFSIPHQVSIARQQILFFIFKWFLIWNLVSFFRFLFFFFFF